MKRHVALALCMCSALAGVGLSQRYLPSRLPAPRYASLRGGNVPARANADRHDRLKWTYRVAGLPVMVVAETLMWRRIRDAEGGVAWVERRYIDEDHPTAINLTGRPVPLRSRRGGKVDAFLVPRALVSLQACGTRGCRIKVGRREWWVADGVLWGPSSKPPRLVPAADGATAAGDAPR